MGKCFFPFLTRQQKSPPCTSTFSWCRVYSSCRLLMLLHTMLRHYINIIAVESYFQLILRLPWNNKLAWPFKHALFFFSSLTYQCSKALDTQSQNILNDILPQRTHESIKTLTKPQSFTYLLMWLYRCVWLFTTASLLRGINTETRSLPA